MDKDEDKVEDIILKTNIELIESLIIKKDKKEDKDDFNEL